MRSNNQKDIVAPLGAMERAEHLRQDIKGEWKSSPTRGRQELNKSECQNDPTIRTRGKEEGEIANAAESLKAGRGGETKRRQNPKFQDGPKQKKRLKKPGPRVGRGRISLVLATREVSTASKKKNPVPIGTAIGKKKKNQEAVFIFSREREREEKRR